MRTLKHICLTLACLFGLEAFGQNPLKDIQERVNLAYNRFYQTKSTQALDSLIEDLEQFRLRRTQHEWITYWEAYALQQKAVTQMAVQKNESSERANERAIALLEGLERKGSETLALWAYCLNFDLAFQSQFVAPFQSRKVERLAEEALDMSKENLRAYLTLGINNFYTPKRFGGGEKVAEYMKKAIKAPDRTMRADYAPAWGKDLAYWYLTRFYINQKQWKLARRWGKEACESFPGHPLLEQEYATAQKGESHEE